MLSALQQQLESMQYLQAHVDALHTGAQALLAVLGAAGAAQVPASAVRALLQPLADEAAQAAPLVAAVLEQQQLLLAGQAQDEAAALQG